MSISNTAVIGVFITIFGLMILLSVTLFATITCCCYAYVEENDKNTPGRLKFGLMSPLRTAPSRFGGIHANQVISGPVDLENQLHQVKSYNAPNNTRISPLSSQIVLNSFPISNANQNKSHSNHNTNTSKDNIQHCNTLEYESAVEKFDNMTEGLFDDLKQNPNLRRAHLETIARRMSFIHYKRDGSNNIQTVLARPSEKKQNYISDQYDSFSRTLMLQSLIQDSVNNDERAIKEVRDPFLHHLVSVGGIVVVVKPFQGREEYEFKYLQPGDLLRIVKFYVRQDSDQVSVKSLSMMKRENDNNISHEELINSNKDSVSGEVTLDGYKLHDEEIFVDKSDPNYGKIYCTGIILNTFLEYNSETSDLSLRVKKITSRTTSDYDLLKDFPLNVVTLETTVLRSMHNAPPTNETI